MNARRDRRKKRSRQCCRQGVQDKEKDDPPPAEEPPSFLELFLQIYPQPQDKESSPFLELGQTDLQPPEDLQGQATERSPSSATDRSRSETSSARILETGAPREHLAENDNPESYFESNQKRYLNIGADTAPSKRAHISDTVWTGKPMLRRHALQEASITSPYKP